MGYQNSFYIVGRRAPKRESCVKPEGSRARTRNCRNFRGRIETYPACKVTMSKDTIIRCSSHLASMDVNCKKDRGAGPDLGLGERPSRLFGHTPGCPTRTWLGHVNVGALITAADLTGLNPRLHRRGIHDMGLSRL